MSKPPSLKSLNLKWLIALAYADVVLVGLVFGPKLSGIADFSSMELLRALGGLVIPVLVVLLVNVLPHDVKAMLVYWRPLGSVPGTEAFTKHAPSDPRIDMDRLAQKVGPFPTSPRDQNSTWYRLFKEVESHVEVEEAHRLYLLYRDMAVLSVALVPIAQLMLYMSWVNAADQWLAIIALSIQYVITALSARWSGMRLVTNVLAIHTTSKIAAH